MDLVSLISGLVLGIVGAVPTVLLMRERLVGVRDLRRLLALSGRSTVEILVTSSVTGISEVGPDEREKRARRTLVPSGDLAGVVELSVMLSRAYPNKRFVVTPSARPRTDPEADNFIVGGPVHNDYAARLVRGDSSFGATGPGVVFDATRRYIRLGATELGPDIDLEFKNNVPAIDYGIVVLSRITNSARSGNSPTRRVLIVAGLTTYGTHAAAHFAAYQLAGYARDMGFLDAPNAAILVRAEFVNGEPYNIGAVDSILESGSA